MSRYIVVLIGVGFLSLAEIASAFYDSNFGRWLNRDPSEERGGENLYAAFLNRPTSLVDYWGLEPNCKDEASCLVCITFAEARGTSDKCQQAVADSVKNRAVNSNKGVCEVVAEKGQYNGYNNDNYNKCCNNECRDIPGGPQDKKERDDAERNAAAGVASEHAGNATYFHDNNIGTPAWIQEKIKDGRMSEVKVPGCNRFRFYQVNR